MVVRQKASTLPIHITKKANYKKEAVINTKWSGIVLLAVFLVITIFGFLFIVFGCVLVWFILKSTNVTTDLMGTIQSLSNALAAAAVFGAGFIAYRELSEGVDSRYIDIADRLFDELNSPDNIAARRRVYQNLPANPEDGLKNMSSEDQEAMKKVLNSLDRVAFLTQPRWISDEIVMPWMHPMISKSWEKLEPYVIYERNRRNEPYFYRFAGELAVRCRKWRARNLIKTDTTWVDHSL